jgi:phage repressor protein C with HTH and peptisase S24 domain
MQVQSCLVPEIGISAMCSAMATVQDDIQLVRDLLAWAGLNPNQVSAKINKPNTTINRFANGTAKFRMHRDTLNALRAAYPEFPGFTDTPETNAIPFKMEGASEERMRDDLPIYGTALGAARQVDGEAIEQTTLNRAEVVQYARRPVLLNGRADAYGLYVSGSSMEPRFDDGDMILIDPKGRVKNGDYVVVYLRPNNPEDDDGEAARAVLVKKLVRRSSGYVELEQFQPATTFRIEAEEVVRMDRVIPWAELLS